MISQTNAVTDEEPCLGTAAAEATEQSDTTSVSANGQALADLFLSCS